MTSSQIRDWETVIAQAKLALNSNLILVANIIKLIFINN